MRIRHVTAAVALAMCTLPVRADVGADTVAQWPPVDESVLGELRGGLNLGALTGYFAIERIVRVDGVDVARTLLVIEDVGRIARGGVPIVHVLGNLANLIQIGPANTAAGVAQQANAAAAAGLARADAALQSAQAAASAAQALAAQAAQVSGPGGPGTGTTSAAANGNSGVNAASNMGSSSMAQFGAGLDQAVGVATGESGAQPPAPVAVRGPATTAPSAPPAVGAAATPAAAAPAARAATAAPVAAPPAAAPPATALTSTLVIPIGATGQVVVVSNIPNAAPLTTAIQNSVAAAQIQAQTRISASLENSLSSLRSGALAASIRQQAAQTLR